MEYIKTGIEGPVIIEPRVFGDARGYFFESFSQRDFEAHVGPVSFVQDNESWSASRGVLRGMHFQKGDCAQAKLVRVARGRVLDVAVDIRPGSPTFGRFEKVELSAGNKRMFFIPRGFAHGFLVLEDDTVFQYKCDNYYAPTSEGSFRWDDPEVGIDWGVDPATVILSEKDSKAPSFRESAESLNQTV